MTEYTRFVNMLNRAGIGYGLRDDADGAVAVQVEDYGFGPHTGVAEFAFDKDGLLTVVTMYEGEAT